MTTQESRYWQYVLAFATRMVRKLVKNQHKGEWGNTDLRDYLDKLHDEVRELEIEIHNLHGSNYDERQVQRIIDESADVANFSMIIASVALRKLDRDLIEEVRKTDRVNSV